jgi:hypothetical protein
MWLLAGAPIRKNSTISGCFSNQNREKLTWNLEPGTWNLEPDTWTVAAAGLPAYNAGGLAPSKDVRMEKRIAAADGRAELLDECYRRAIDLLRRNSVAEGVLACSRGERAAGRSYTSIFGRDHAICALGMVASGDAELIATARAGLLTLARHQAPNGQIPKFVRPEKGEADFWYSGCIDATLWWLIAIRDLDRHSGAGLGAELGEPVQRALSWLQCQEHPTWGLLQQNEASDWADIMPRSGFVLYSNVLWFVVKRLYGLPGAQLTREYINFLFHPYDNSVPENRRARLLAHYIRKHSRPGAFYLSFVNFSFWGEEIDILGNLLVALTGVADSSRAVQIAEGVKSLRVAQPWPVRVVGRPIEPEHPLWRLYMQRHRQNYPFQYHNGGCWPFAGGFWVLLLTRLGWTGQAGEALAQLAEANRVGGWEFNEWLHGQSGAPSGMAGQSWNAAMYLLAYEHLRKKRPLFSGSDLSPSAMV